MKKKEYVELINKVKSVRYNLEAKKIEVVYASGTTRNFTKEPNWINDFCEEAYNIINENGETVYSHDIDYLINTYSTETVAESMFSQEAPAAEETQEEVQETTEAEATSYTAATAEETAATIKTVDVEISRDENFREHTMTTKSAYYITYSDGTSENIETINTGSQEEVPAYLVDFLRTAKHETISNCYWYEEILYTATATTVKIEKPVETPEAETEKAETTEAPAMGCIYEVKFDDEDITVLSIWRLPNDYYRVDTDSRSCKISSSYNTFSEAVESYKYTRNKKIEGSATAEETYNRLTEEETAMISDATETPEETEQFNDDIMYTYDIYYNESDFATESDRYFNTIKECIDNLKYHEIKYFKIYEYNKLIDMVTNEVYIICNTTN